MVSGCESRPPSPVAATAEADPRTVPSVELRISANLPGDRHAADAHGHVSRLGVANLSHCLSRPPSPVTATCTPLTCRTMYFWLRISATGDGGRHAGADRRAGGAHSVASLGHRLRQPPPCAICRSDRRTPRYESRRPPPHELFDGHIREQIVANLSHRPRWPPPVCGVTPDLVTFGCESRPPSLMATTLVIPALILDITQLRISATVSGGCHTRCTIL